MRAALLLIKQVACGPCSAYAGHLYERIGPELGVSDGMTMKTDFCNDLVSTCSEIDFPTYENGMSYCDKHVDNEGDVLWSYPIDPEGKRARAHCFKGFKIALTAS